MRKVVAVVGVVGLIVAVPIAVLAASGGGTAKVNREHFSWTTSPASTSSKGFTSIPGLSVDGLCAANGASVTVSLTLSGDSSEFRVLDDNVGGSFVMRPGVASLHASSTPVSRSFTFVEGAPALGAPHINSFVPQWRSVTGAPVKLTGGTANVVYEDAGHAC